MEETVWMIVGIISILLVFGILMSFTQQRAETDEFNMLESSMDSLMTRCNNVCASPRGTYLNSRVTIPTESVLVANGRSMCIDYADRRVCRSCNCDLIPGTIINLTGSRDVGLSGFIDYVCFFDRHPDNITMTCRG